MLRRERVSPQHLVGERVVDHGAVGADRRQRLGQLVVHHLEPADRTAGDQDDRRALRGDPREHVGGAWADGVVVADQRAVDVGGDQAGCLFHHRDSSRSRYTATPSSSLRRVTSSAAARSVGVRVGHRHPRPAGPLEHRQVVGHVTEDQHVGRVDPEGLRHHGQPGRLVHAGRADLDEAEPGLGERGDLRRDDPAGHRQQLVHVVVGGPGERLDHVAGEALGAGARLEPVLVGPALVVVAPERRVVLVGRLDHHGQRADLGLQVGEQPGQHLGGQPLVAEHHRAGRVALVDHPSAAGHHQEVGGADVVAGQFGQPGAAAGRADHRNSGGPHPVEHPMGVRGDGLVAADQRPVEVGRDQLGQSRAGHRSSFARRRRTCRAVRKAEARRNGGQQPYLAERVASMASRRIGRQPEAAHRLRVSRRSRGAARTAVAGIRAAQDVGVGAGEGAAGVTVRSAGAGRPSSAPGRGPGDGARPGRRRVPGPVVLRRPGRGQPQGRTEQHTGHERHHQATAVLDLEAVLCRVEEGSLTGVVEGGRGGDQQRQQGTGQREAGQPGVRPHGRGAAQAPAPRCRPVREAPPGSRPRSRRPRTPRRAPRSWRSPRARRSAGSSPATHRPSRRPRPPRPDRRAAGAAEGPGASPARDQPNRRRGAGSSSAPHSITAGAVGAVALPWDGKLLGHRPSFRRSRTWVASWHSQLVRDGDRRAGVRARSVARRSPFR